MGRKTTALIFQETNRPDFTREDPSKVKKSKTWERNWIYLITAQNNEIKTIYFSAKSDSKQEISHHHHHHVVPLARISLTLSRHFSLSFIASGRSSELHAISSYSCWMYVRAGRPAFARPYVGVHRSTSLMSSSLLLQQCPRLWGQR